jgi:FMN phosphatase YigB (HAD superfamily)
MVQTVLFDLDETLLDRDIFFNGLLQSNTADSSLTHSLTHSQHIPKANCIIRFIELKSLKGDYCNDY